MAGSATDIRIASNALQLFGHSSITSFQDGTAGAEIASALYESSYKFLLTTYRWRFATKKAKLARLSGKPISDYNYMFQIPTDCLYIIRPTTTADYEVYGETIHTNVSVMTIDYIYNVPSDKLPHYYIKVLEFFLSSQFALPVTGDINKSTLMEQMYSKLLKQAKYADSSQRPNDSFEDNPYIDARFS